MPETQHPIDIAYEATTGGAFHEWVVSDQLAPDGWWGDGYILHTTCPSFLAKWGVVSREEASAFGSGIQIDEERSLVILTCSIYTPEDQVEQDELSMKKSEAISVLLEYFTRQQN